jgi:hypothetical protein
VLAVAASVVLGFRYAKTAWLVTEQNRNEPAYVEIGQYARANLPANAVLLVDETTKLEHKTAMFWTDRAAYPLVEPWESHAAAIRRAGGDPYVVSPTRCRCRSK